MPVQITLKKSEYNIPWGFRLHGGKDFGAPLTVQRIKAESLASKSGLLEGDNIFMINNETTNGLKHLEAQEVIKKGGCSLNLTICRGDEIVVKHIKDTNSVETDVEYEMPRNNKSVTSNIPSPYKPSFGTTSFKPSPSITSNNASLYKPTMQTLTSGLTNLQTEDDFPAPPPLQSFSPHRLTPLPSFPEVSVSTGNGEKNSDANKFVNSETYKLVKEIDSGNEIPFSPKTGLGMNSSPLQSRLMGILEKKHGLVEHEKQQEDALRGLNRGYTPSKSPIITNETNQTSNDFKSPSSLPTNNHSDEYLLNRATPSQFQLRTQNHKQLSKPSLHQPSEPSFKQHLLSPTQPIKSSQQPSQPPLSQSRTLLKSMDNGSVPICNVCNVHVSGAYVLALSRIWCPDHFICSNGTCKKPLSTTGFVEEAGKLYCKEDYEKYFAPKCDKCAKPIVGNTLKALKGMYHPDCFTCHKCLEPIAGGVFHLHEGQVYCDKDFSLLFSTKCLGCNFPIEVGDNWIEAAGTNWHGNCFNCSVCHENLQSTGFVNRNGRFVCKDHAKMA